jgi:hypothetical protein
MKIRQQPYDTKHFVYSLFMVLLLSWLTVCLPYVNEQQLGKATLEQTADETPEVDSKNLSSGTNEEKSESGMSLFSEYLSALNSHEPVSVNNSAYRKCCSTRLYMAYHPDLVIPPPEV